jgi:uncharacterized alpha-E superfamily protein
MLAATVSLSLDGDMEPAQCWRPIVVVSGEQDEFRARIANDDPDDAAWGDGELVQRFMVWDEQNGVSLARTIGGMRWNARSIRDVLSAEAWEVVNELHLWFRDDAPAIYANQREAFYQQVRRATQLALGLLRSTMLHDEPLDFMWLGVLLERTNQTARLLDVHHHAFAIAGVPNELVETGVWLSLLRALSGSEAYLKRAAGRISSEAVARFLVSEDAFPRSIAYCVHAAYARLCDLRPPEQHELPGGASVTRLHALDDWVAARAGEPLAPDAVHALLTHVVDEVHAICGTLGHELLGAPLLVDGGAAL